MKKIIIILSFFCAVNLTFAQEKVAEIQDKVSIKSEVGVTNANFLDQKKEKEVIVPDRNGVWIIEESDIVSALAALVAIFAFYVSYRRYETAKKTLLMSQPVLELFFDELPLQPNDLRFALVLQNKGLSPAIIKDVSYLGQSIKIDGYSENYSESMDNFEKTIEPIHKKIITDFFKGPMEAEFAEFLSQIKSFTFTLYPKIGDIISHGESLHFGVVTLYPEAGEKIIYDGKLAPEAIPSLMYLLKLHFSESYNKFFTIHYKSLSDFEQSLNNINKEYFLEVNKTLEIPVKITES